MDPIAIQIKEDNGNRKVIGHIRGDTFYTTRKKSKHLLRKLNAWGIDAEVLNDILQRQVKYIEVRDKGLTVLAVLPVRSRPTGKKSIILVACGGLTVAALGFRTRLTG